MSFIARKVGRKVAGNKLAAYEPEDPHYGKSHDSRARLDVPRRGTLTCERVLQKSTSTRRDANVTGSERCLRV